MTSYILPFSDSFLFNLIWTILGLKVIYCFSYEKVVSNFCHRESKSAFAELRRNFRTKDLDVKLEARSQKPLRCDKLHIAV